MADLIILLIIAVILFFAIKTAMKHFKGDAVCCGGGDEIVKEPDKKLEGEIIATKTMKIKDMSCENCENRVKRALNKIDGVSAAVSWKKGEAVISCDREVADDALRRAVTQAGYEVVSLA